MIILSQVTKVFEQGLKRITALSNVTLQVLPGQIFGIIGASGAGKSTLIRCVNLLETPSSGQVIVDGRDLCALTEKELMQARRQIGMIFQQFNLLNSQTVLGNVALPLKLSGESKKIIRERVMNLLELVGLADKRDANIGSLSGGQKQRVAIARALANNPKVLLCDEATSALDPATTQSILALLKKINKELGLTLLLITHEMEVVKTICDQVAIIDGGKLIEQGPVGTIFSHPKTPLAQEFIQSTLHMEIPDDYLQRLSDIPNKKEMTHILLKLEFTGNSIDSPMLSEITRRFDVNNNIIKANLDQVGGVRFGILLTEMVAPFHKIQEAIIYLNEQHVNVKVLGYV